MELSDFKPQSKLVSKTTEVLKPRFPVVDAHNHLTCLGGRDWLRSPLSELLDLLDEAGIVHFIDLDGGWGEDLLRMHLDYFKAKAPERFQIFGGVDWTKWETLGNKFPDWAAIRLEAQKKAGAQGLKVWKNLGLHVKDQTGSLVTVDDVRLEPIWQAAGELGLPVLIHIADPVAFFDKLDANNERWEELAEHPDWSFPSPPFPPFIEIADSFFRMVKRNPGTVFIGAHVGCHAENLVWVARMLDLCPNYFIDISARLGELGRQPYSARRFLIDYQDRAVFGTDNSPSLDQYRLHYRFLETDDEYFNYNTTALPSQGRWYVHGLHLPGPVLKKLYSGNAARIFKVPLGDG